MKTKPPNSALPKPPRWLLIVPPVGDCTMPMLGPLVLCGHIKQVGGKAIYRDASIELFRQASNPNIVRQILLRAKNSSYRFHSSTSFAQSKNIIVDSEDSIGVLEHAAETLSCISEGVRFSLDDVSISRNLNSRNALFSALHSIECFELFFIGQTFWDDLSNGGITHVGISISYSGQFVFALLIARLIKRNFPDTNMTFGGSYFDNPLFEPQDLLTWFPFLDCIVVGPGESVLGSVKDAQDKLTGVLQNYGGMMSVFPDCTDVRWRLYAAGANARILPFSFRLPCYYGRCSFCNGDRTCGKQHWNVDDFNTAMTQLVSAIEQGNITGVYFADAAIPDVFLLRIAAKLNGRVLWGCNARVDKPHEKTFFDTLFKSGCTMLRLGIESGSQNVLNLMKKGTMVRNYVSYIRNAAKAGIRVHAYLMLGFPGETEEDRMQTLRFLSDNSLFLYSFSISVFHAIPNTPIYGQLKKKFGVPREIDKDINTLYYSEDSYHHILSWVDRLQQVLSHSHSNRYCYSGRVFMDNPEPISCTEYNHSSVIQNNIS